MATGNLATFLEALRHWGRLWAPIEKVEGVFTLEPIVDVTAARPEALTTLIPFKKLLLKPKFVMMAGNLKGTAEESTDNDAGPQVYFGAHACDIHALKILDMLYLSDHVDPFYARNRKNLTVVGYGCWPDEQCFCDSMDTSTANDGFDLFLSPLKGRFLVAVLSARGDEIIGANQHLFAPATAADTEEYLAYLKRRKAAFQLSLDVTDLPYILDLKKDDPVWDQIGASCLCCGSCSMVCPTCSCFSVIDEILDDDRAQRFRVWDSCLFRDYATVAGGHNFRADRADRVRNRYYHKQEAFVREFGMPSCVGCGRCIESCPTGINVVEVFKQVRGEL